MEQGCSAAASTASRLDSHRNYRYKCSVLFSKGCLMRSFLPLFVVPLAIATPVLAAEVVPVPAFRSIELHGGGDVTIVPGQGQRVTIVDGSSQFTQFRVGRDGKLRIDACNNRCPHHYQLRIQIQSPRVPDLAIRGGGAIRVQGGYRAQSDLSAAINGGGKIDTRALDTAKVSAAVNGGGELLVRARSDLAAAVNGGGVIRYAGNPRVASAIHGGGLVVPGN